MRSVGGDVDGLPTRGLAKVCNESVQDDRKVVQKGVKADTRGNSEEVESRKNGEENGGRVELRQAQTAPQKQHELQHLPQSQSSVVRWDRFLPLRSLKVLLVENDDSTRHVVGALLRNCSYEVTSVSNGLEAWRMLADLTNHIDLVLTEVAMPGLSGIALLSKIMNHKTCKNIPVIMTSSNDSMGIVFKCLSKGAVDFLVKPIRKNELKNLWQHVWRKCHSSSGSGSESGTRTQKSIKSKNVQGSDNHADSNDDDEERSIGLNYRNGSDNGSGTQSSWSKRAVEVDSPRPMSPWEGSADPPDSTCALVIHSKPGVDVISWVPTNTSKKSQKQNDLSDNMAMGKHLTIGVPRDTDLQMKGPINGVLAKATHTHNEKGTCTNADLEKVRDKLRSLEYHNDKKKDKLLGKDSDLMGANTNIPMAHGGSAGNEVPYDSSKITTTLKDMAPSNTKELPSVMPSLKRPRESNAVTTTQERNVLRHSDNSAFSRYNTVSTANQTTTAVVGSCSPANNSSEAANKAESLLNLQSNSSGTPNQGSNGSSNNNDMGSTTNKGFTKSEVLSKKPAPKSTTLAIQGSSAFQPVQHGHNSSLQPVTSGKPDTAKNTPGQQTQVEHHHHHHYHHHHHHVHNLQQQQQLLNTDDMSFGNMITGSPQFEQSNMSIGGIEDDAANYGSASGSNNGSNGQNGQNGSSTAVVVEEMNMASDVGVGGTGKCGTVEAVVATGNRISMDQDRLAQREAALNKFRLKRKERCFDKKVRYQSRKKLAEQRPRIRGQFVRQTVDENKIKDKSNNPDS